MSAFLAKYRLSLLWALADLPIAFRDGLSVWHATRPSTLNLIEDITFLAATLVAFATEKSKKG